MSLTVLQRPNQNNNWNAGFNPVLYKMQRKDYSITAVANSGGALQITVDTNLTTLAANKGGPVAVGAVLWVQTDNGVYNAAYTVVSVTNAASSVVTFGANTYTSAATTGFINLAQRTGYQVEVQVFAANGSAPSSGALFTMKFTPSKSGLLTMDVSTLRNYLQPEVSANIAAITNANNTAKVRPNTVSNYNFYIKYTETWISSSGTASAETQTDDTANRAFMVMAARQVGELYGGYLKEYSDSTGRKFLNRNPNPIIYQGRKFTVSFIDPAPSGTARTHIKKTRYNIDGTVWGATYDVLDYSGGTPNPNIFEAHEDCTSTYYLGYDKQDTTGTAWTNLGLGLAAQVILTASATSRKLLIPLFLKQDTAYTFTANITNTGATGTNVATLELVTLAGTVRGSDTENIPVGTANYTFTVTPTTSDTYYLQLNIACGATGGTFTLNSFLVNNLPTANKIDFQIVTHTLPPFTITEALVSETLTCLIQDVCARPIHLFWKNHLGGDQSFLFAFNQTYSTQIKSGNKVNRYKCFAQNLTLDTFNMLNELLSAGEVYEPAIVEMSTSVNKTQARIGQQVYAVDVNGGKTGVVVIPTTNQTRTMQSRHSIAFEIEMPATIHPS